jgi:hypothetical protein
MLSGASGVCNHARTLAVVFVHTFMGDGHQFVEPAAVDPKDLPEDPLAGPAESI